MSIKCQTIKIGLSGSEQEIPSFGARVFDSTSSNLISNSGRSADGTLHTDFVTRKGLWSINYNIVTEATKTLFDSIFDLQLAGQFLSFSYTENNGNVMTFAVQMQPISYGKLIPIKKTYYYNGATINLEQV